MTQETTRESAVSSRGRFHQAKSKRVMTVFVPPVRRCANSEVDMPASAQKHRLPLCERRNDVLNILEVQLAEALRLRSRAKLVETLSAGAWIYGASQYGRAIATAMQRLGLPALGFIDVQADTLGMIGDLPVVAPNAFTSHKAEGKCLVFGLVGPNHCAEEILAFADHLPFRDRLWNGDLPEVLGEYASHMWLVSRTSIQDAFEEIRNVAMTLEDDASFNCLTELVRYRITGRHCDHPTYEYERQYLPADMAGFDKPIVFVDGGAFTGDTGLMLQKHGVKLAKWLAFEPDKRNFSELAATVTAAGLPAALFPNGLSNRMHQLRFVPGLGMGSHLAKGCDSNAEMIQCVAFDDAMPNCAPDFIKLDIEGGEVNALDGMKHAIMRHRPRLAISAYHRPYDLWEIPLKLMELLPDAKLYIRQHGYNGYETVVYALP